MEKKGVVLIVEDEVDLRDFIASECEEMGVVALQAGDGLEALAQLEKNEVHAILSDINMPRMNGLKLLEAVRERGIDIPFIILTAYAEQKNTIQALRLGAMDFIEKPFDKSVLLETLERAVRIGRELRLLDQELKDTQEKNHLSPNVMERIREIRRSLTIVRSQVAKRVSK